MALNNVVLFNPMYTCCKMCVIVFAIQNIMYVKKQNEKKNNKNILYVNSF